MTQPISDNGMMRFNSLELTGYRFEMIGRKPESLLEKLLKKEQKKQYVVQECLSDVKAHKLSDLYLNAVLLSDDKRLFNTQKANLKTAEAEQRRLKKSLVERRKKALEKLFIEDSNAYELELQSVGKSMYRHYK